MSSLPYSRQRSRGPLSPEGEAAEEDLQYLCGVSGDMGPLPKPPGEAILCAHLHQRGMGVWRRDVCVRSLRQQSRHSGEHSARVGHRVP